MRVLTRLLSFGNKESVDNPAIFCLQSAHGPGCHPLLSRSVLTRPLSFGPKESVSKVAVIWQHGGRLQGLHPLTSRMASRVTQSSHLKDGVETVAIIWPQRECQWCRSSFGIKASTAGSLSHDFKGGQGHRRHLVSRSGMTGSPCVDFEVRAL